MVKMRVSVDVLMVGSVSLGVPSAHPQAMIGEVSCVDKVKLVVMVSLQP